MTVLVQAAKIKDRFLRKERREPQRNRTCEVEGGLGCRRVEKSKC